MATSGSNRPRAELAGEAGAMGAWGRGGVGAMDGGPSCAGAPASLLEVGGQTGCLRGAGGGRGGSSRLAPARGAHSLPHPGQRGHAGPCGACALGGPLRPGPDLSCHGAAAGRERRARQAVPESPAPAGHRAPGRQDAWAPTSSALPRSLDPSEGLTPSRPTSLNQHVGPRSVGPAPLLSSCPAHRGAN